MTMSLSTIFASSCYLLRPSVIVSASPFCLKNDTLIKMGFSRNMMLGFSISRTCVVESKGRTPSLHSDHELWEDPDDGSGSEYEEEEDDDEEEEDNDLDYESDWDEERGSVVSSTAGSIDKQTAIQYEKELARAIEELLDPDERAILQQNPTPNLKKISTEKWKPLETLAMSLQIPSMDRLLENGIHIDESDKDGRTALHKVIMGKKEAVISHLLRRGASPHVKDQDGATPLHHAVQVGAIQTVKLLIKCGVDVNVADNEGWTPLHVAVQSRNRDITKILLINGADKTRRNKLGKTAMDISLCYGKDFKSYELAKLLKIIPADRNM